MNKTTTANNPIREKILKAAVRLLGDCGIRKVMQPQIAKKAGVPQGHMTYYFPTREDLLLAVAEKSIQVVTSKVMKSLAGKKTLNADEILELLGPLIKDEQRSRMLLGLLVESDDNKKLREQLINQSEMGNNLIALSMGKDPSDSDVWLVQAALLGIGLQYFINPTDEASRHVDQALKLLREKFAGGEK